MRKATFYVGVDVGQKELWACIPGQKPRRFATSSDGVNSLWHWANAFAGDATLHFAMEATGVYSERVALPLQSYPETQVSINNAAQIHWFAKAMFKRCKSDPIDAQVILAFAESREPRSWQPESPALRTLAQLVKQLRQLQNTRRDWLNRQHTNKQRLSVPSAVTETTRTLLESLEAQIGQVEKEIKHYCNTTTELKQRIDLLQTIKGVGQVTAVAVLAYGKSALWQRSARQLTAHAGLAPSPQQSGTSLHTSGHLAKEGNADLRRSLYMATLVACFHNPIIKPFYQRLLLAGKPQKVALTASMHKLLLIIRAILISRQPFHYQKAVLT